MSKILNRYIFMKPDIRGIIEWAILITLAILSDLLSILMIISNIVIHLIGYTLFGIGLIIHAISHIHHKQAHSKAGEIKYIVTHGIYSKIRHPGYLGIILAYIGFSLWWNSIVPLIIALILSILLVVTALEEEKFLLKKFGRVYEEYMRKVKWRFIPGLF